MRRLAGDWEKLFTQDTDDKGLFPKIYEELLKFIAEEMSNPIKRCTKDLNKTPY